MIKALTIWGTIFSSLLGTTYYAAAKGVGVQQPNKKPPSIREGSVKDSSGRSRTRYFVGGGLHGGK